MPEMRRHIILLTYMVNVAISLSLAFNIDSRDSQVIPGPKDDYFGYKVLQFASKTDKGIIVTAPLQGNGSGAICQTVLSKKERVCFAPKDISVKNSTILVKHLGLSLAKNPLHSQFTVCSPSLAHECNDSSYLNSVCYTLTDNIKQISNFTPAFQDCTKKTVNLVFLFDGSKSMTESEFTENKHFIEEIMANLSGSSIKFAAVQFSSIYRTVFDFNQYTAGDAHKLLMEEPHMKGLTNTHRALTFVLDDIFEKTSSGASPDATKVLILITDGDPSDSDEEEKITDKYNEKNVIRFVIGVKVNDLSKFKEIASDENHAFKIDDYKGLTGILEKFQTRIFKIEGSTVAQAGDLKNEMSQSGFSTAFHKDTLILGAVGSNAWRGALMEFRNGIKTQIEDSLMDKDSYLGYSTAVGEKNNATLYFAGAPRFDYKGCVVVFMRVGSKWSPVERTRGDQIGSYFGAELCSLDVDSDGNTDFLLVGAPLFYQPQQKTEGRIYVYTLTAETNLSSVLTVTATSKGRFGTSISRLADLNGDGLQDVAVGAPLEDDNRGAVYIFLGDKQSGIRSTFSQKIMGEQVKPELRFFGLATDGNTDLGSDGLPDIVVGSQGNIVVFSYSEGCYWVNFKELVHSFGQNESRSRPVFNVFARLAFHPEEISTEKIDCFGNTDKNLPMVTLKACFEMRETTKSNSVERISGLNISCKFDVDAMRSTSRGFFSETDRKARTLTVTYELRDTKKDTCFNYSIYMPRCVRDTLSPISIKLYFAQENSESAAMVLNVDSTLQADVEVPFQKVCRQNDTCIAELEVDFNFTTPTLLVTEESYFNMSITLSNQGDDSYNTSLSMHYPPSLSFSRMTLTKASRSTPHNCQDLEGVFDKTICGVSLPVYRSRASATFMASFHILHQSDWNDTVLITVAGQSDNTNSSRNSSLTKAIPVQFQIRMAVSTGEDTVTYLNLTTEDCGPKTLETIYKIDNLGFKSFPVSVSLTFPTKLEHSFEMKNYKVSEVQNKTWCETEATLQSCAKEKECKTIVCDPFILEKESSAEFRLSGDVHFRDLKQIAANIAFFKRFTGASDQITFRSSIHVSYDQERYVLDSHKQQGESSEGGSSNNDEHVSKWADVRVEFMILPDQLLIKATGAGLGFLLLIIMTIIMLKLGCFKRKKFDEMQEEETAQEDESTLAAAKSEPDSKSEEDKALLKGTEANSNTLPEDSKEELD